MMDFNSILTFLRPELSLLAVIIILLLYDLCASEKGKKHFQTVAYVLFGAHTLWSFCLVPDLELFGGMFVTSKMASLVKAILSVATFIVLLQANNSLKKEDSSFKTGEFYMLTLSTLFGMYIMISSGNFLIFYLGLEVHTYGSPFFGRDAVRHIDDIRYLRHSLFRRYTVPSGYERASGIRSGAVHGRYGL